MPSQNSYVEALTPNGGGLWKWGLWRCLGLHEVMREGPHGGISVLKRDQSALSAVYGHSEKLAVYKPGRVL